MTTIRKSRITIDAEWNEKYQTECFEQIDYYLVDEDGDIYDDLFSFQYYFKAEVVDGQPAWKNKLKYIAIDEMLDYNEYEEKAQEDFELSDFKDEIDYIKEMYENVEKHIDMDSINSLLK